MQRHGINLNPEAVQALCRRHNIKELFIFGSILRNDFRPDSDVDFVVRLEDGDRITVSKLMSIEDELSALTGRPVDVVLGSEIDAPDANPYRKRHILATMEPLVGW